MNALVSNVLTQVFITLIAVSGCAVTISHWSRWASARRLPPC